MAFRIAALGRLRRHLENEDGADGEPLEGAMMIDDFIIWVRKRCCPCACGAILRAAAHLQGRDVREKGLVELICIARRMQWEANGEDRLELFSELQAQIKQEWLAEERVTKQHEAEELMMRGLEATGGTLAIYLPTGRKKHDRHFKICVADGTISWSKKLQAKTTSAVDTNQASPSKFNLSLSSPAKKSDKVVGVQPQTKLQNGEFGEPFSCQCLR
jgi:hypothetical protein